MQKKSYFQLSGLTFFQYFVAGATSPMLGTYLKDTLGFSGAQTGILLTLFQTATMAAPLAAAFLADRLVSSRSLYALLNLAAAVLSILLAGQTSFWPFLILFVAYAGFLGPTGGLVNALIFARTPDGQGQYGLVRLWGTVGWVAVAGLLALLWLAPGASVSWMFWVGAGGNLAAAAASLLLPRGSRSRPPGRFRLFPREAFQVFARPALLKIGAVAFLGGLLDRFHSIATAPYLKQLGFGDSSLMAVMTLGQVAEIFLLLATGPVLKRWGLRTALLVGLLTQSVRFGLLALNPGPVWLILALALNGFVFAFFYAVVTIYVDGHTRPETRAGVHQLLGLLIFGTSSIVGSLLAGFAFDWFAQGGRVDYFWFWSLPFAFSLVAAGLVLVFFSSREKAEGSRLTHPH